MARVAHIRDTLRLADLKLLSEVAWCAMERLTCAMSAKRSISGPNLDRPKSISFEPCGSQLRKRLTVEVLRYMALCCVLLDAAPLRNPELTGCAMPLESRFVDRPRCICAANGLNADAAPSQQVIKRIVRTSRCCHYDAICVDPAHARRFVDVGDIRCRAVDIFDDVMGDYLDLGFMQVCHYPVQIDFLRRLHSDHWPLCNKLDLGALFGQFDGRQRCGHIRHFVYHQDLT